MFKTNIKKHIICCFLVLFQKGACISELARGGVPKIVDSLLHPKSVGLIFIYLNMDGALSDVEVEAADRLGSVPLALPVEVAGNLPPESRRILNGLLVHLLILHKQLH